MEYDVDTTEGRPKAVNVTGPGGVFVEGAPRRMYKRRGRGGKGSQPKEEGVSDQVKDETVDN